MSIAVLHYPPIIVNPSYLIKMSKRADTLNVLTIYYNIKIVSIKIINNVRTIKSKRLQMLVVAAFLNQ